jgi:hypothetical protein
MRYLKEIVKFTCYPITAVNSDTQNFFWRNKATDLIENKEKAGKKWRNKPTVCVPRVGATTAYCGHRLEMDTPARSKA